MWPTNVRKGSNRSQNLVVWQPLFINYANPVDNIQETRSCRHAHLLGNHEETIQDSWI